MDRRLAYAQRQKAMGVRHASLLMHETALQALDRYAESLGYSKRGDAVVDLLQKAGLLDKKECLNGMRPVRRA